MLPSTGSTDSPIWFVAAKPRTAELNARKLLAPDCNTGRTFRQMFRTAGIPQNAFYCALYGGRGPVGGWSGIKANPKANAKLIENLQTLQSLALEHKPNLVITLGQNPLEELTGHSDLAGWRGHTLWSPILNCKVLPTYDPGHAKAQKFHKPKPGLAPGALEALLRIDLNKAVKEAQTRSLNYAKYNCITSPSYSEAVSWLETALQEARILSYDLEILPPYEAQFMDCIGLSCSLHEAICIKFFTPAGKPIYTKEQTLHIFGLLSQLLESPIPKVAQNSQFDTIVLAEGYSIEVRNIIWDTMIAMNNLWCELPKNLGTLISLYTNLPNTKHLMAADRYYYCAMDALANLHVMQGQREEMSRYGILDHFETLTMPALDPLIAMQLEGVKVDEEARKEAIEELETILNAYQRAFNLLFTMPDGVQICLDSNARFRDGYLFNPNSSDQRRILLYDWLGEQTQYAGGKVTASNHALDVLLEKAKNPITRPIVRALQKFSGHRNLISKLRTPLRNGRIHTAYGLGGVDNRGEETDTKTGTETGRLSSKKPSIYTRHPKTGKLVAAGTNLQNLKKGYSRASLIPDTDEGFCHVDLYSAEALVVAVSGHDLALIDLIFHNKKSYQWILDLARKLFPAECDKYRLAYDITKKFNHAWNYGGFSKRLEDTTGVPAGLIETLSLHYHKTFPGAKRRMELIETELETYGYLRSPLGRQRFFLSGNRMDLLKEAYAYPSQSVIGELTIRAMFKLYYWGLKKKPWVFPALNTHDGLAIRYKLGTESEVEQLVLKAFRREFQVGGRNVIVPIEIGWGPDFNTVRNKKVHWYGQLLTD